MIRSMISPMIKPMITSMVNPDATGTQRVFIDLDGGHYVLSTPETLTGDFQIKYATTTAATEMDFADGFGITAGGLFKAPASVTDIELNGVSVGLAAAAPLSGKLNTVKFIGAVSETITVFGQSGSGTNFFNGVLADPSLPGANWNLDEPTANTELSAEGNNTLTYVNVAIADRELMALTNDDWWGNLAPNLISESESKESVSGDGQSITQPMIENAGVNVDGRNNAIRYSSPVGGFTQNRVVIPANYDYYTYSFDIKALDSVGTISTGNLGVSGAGGFSGVIYDVSTDTLNALWTRRDLSDGWIRLTLGKVKFDNRGSSTIFTSRLDSGSDADKVLLSRFQLEVGTAENKYSYTVGVAGSVLRVARQDVFILGDSFTTSTFEDELILNFVNRGSQFNIDGIGGSNLVQQAGRFDSESDRYGDVLIIMDGGLSDSSVNAINAIDSMTDHLTHDRWVYVQPSPGENIEGSANRITFNDTVAAIRDHVGSGHYVECLTALKAGNDGSANDLQDVADNIVPRSLRTDDIHENEAGTSIRTNSVSRFIQARKW